MAYDWEGISEEDLSIIEADDPETGAMLRQREETMSQLKGLDGLDVAESCAIANEKYITELNNPDLTKEGAVAIASHLSFAVTMLTTKLRMECDHGLILPGDTPLN